MTISSCSLSPFDNYCWSELQIEGCLYGVAKYRNWLVRSESCKKFSSLVCITNGTCSLSIHLSCSKNWNFSDYHLRCRICWNCHEKFARRHHFRCLESTKNCIKGINWGIPLFQMDHTHHRLSCSAFYIYSPSLSRIFSSCSHLESSSLNFPSQKALLTHIWPDTNGCSYWADFLSGRASYSRKQRFWILL